MSEYWTKFEDELFEGQMPEFNLPQPQIDDRIKIVGDFVIRDIHQRPLNARGVILENKGNQISIKISGDWLWEYDRAVGHDAKLAVLDRIPKEEIVVMDAIAGEG